MRQLTVLGLVLLTGGAVSMGCAADEASDPAPTGTTVTSGGGSPTTTSSAGGAGGATSTGGGGEGGSAPDACLTNPVMDHLLIAEVATQPNTGEFVEIWNRSAQTVDLSLVHLADNSEYHTVTSGPWEPITSNPGTDFLVKFPAGTTLGPDERLVVQMGDEAWATSYPAAPCPDFVLYQPTTPLSCGDEVTAAMEVPTNGESGSSLGSMLSNSREMLMLFCWDGQSPVVHDIDYVTWGDQNDPGARADKTGIAGYDADTATAAQSPAPAYVYAPVPAEADEAHSIARCDATENGEATAGGNGIVGHDETSENLQTSFSLQPVASPGAAATCD